jgi:hypothetical protein
MGSARVEPWQYTVVLSLVCNCIELVCYEDARSTRGNTILDRMYKHTLSAFGIL